MKKLTRVSADIVEGNPKLYMYLASEEITAAKYFPADCGLKGGDIVWKINIALSGSLVNTVSKDEYYIKADAEGNLTAVKLAAAA